MDEAYKRGLANENNVALLKLTTEQLSERLNDLSRKIDKTLSGIQDIQVQCATHIGRLDSHTRWEGKDET